MNSAMATILHVEDDPSLQNLVRITLAELGGFEVMTAVDGFRAIDLAHARTPDLVLLDLDLPGMSGVQTLEALRELHALKPVPVIFLTAAPQMSTHVDLLRLGAASVLRKPCRPRQLVQAIRRAMGMEELS